MVSRAPGRPGAVAAARQHPRRPAARHAGGPPGRAARLARARARADRPPRARPVRRGQLGRGARPARGRAACGCASAHGNEAIFGGSYGWASAGRFHHAQSQLHRFLDLLGGYTAVGQHLQHRHAPRCCCRTWSGTRTRSCGRATTWPTIVEHTELIVAFGGIPEKNVVRHPGRDDPARHRRVTSPQLAARGAEVVLVSPLRADLPDRPGRARGTRSSRHRRRADARARAHAGRPRACTTRASSTATAIGYEHLRALPARRRRRRAQGRRPGPGRSAASIREDHPAASRAGWRPRAR